MKILFKDDLTPYSVIDFLRGPRLWVAPSSYPDFNDWLERIEPELAGGTKRHLACYWNNEFAGIVIWQRHKTHQSYVEIKNLTVHPRVRGRLVGSFLLRQAELEGRNELTANQAVCDAKRAHAGILSFLLARGYKCLGAQDLYGLGGGEDIVLGRPIKQMPP